jgi:hypothetical protein
LGLAGSTLWAVNDSFFLAPLVVLGDTHAGTALTADQAQGLALVLLHVHAQGGNILLVLFGCHVILIGALIFRSTFLAPQFAAHLSPYLLIPGTGEIVLALWLLVPGVNAERWKEQTSAAGGRQ